MQYAVSNKLKINDSKTEFMVFRSPQAKQDMSNLAVSVGDSVIAQSSGLYSVRDLGVIFDQFLNFCDYISSVCRSTYFHLRNIGKMRHLLSYDACAQLIHDLIPIRLDYCNSLLYSLPKNSTCIKRVTEDTEPRQHAFQQKLLDVITLVKF